MPIASLTTKPSWKTNHIYLKNVPRHIPTILPLKNPYSATQDICKAPHWRNRSLNPLHSYHNLEYMRFRGLHLALQK